MEPKRFSGHCGNCGKGLYWGEECSAEPLCIACADKPRRTVAEIRAEIESQLQYCRDGINSDPRRMGYFTIRIDTLEHLLKFIDGKDGPK